MADESAREPSRTPPWGSPRQAPPAGQLPDTVVERPAQPAFPYTVLVEQSVGSGESIRWAPVEHLESFPDRETARAAAEYLARTFRPKHPFSPRERVVLRLDPDRYTVIVRGMSSTFHFAVSVAEVVERRAE